MKTSAVTRRQQSGVAMLIFLVGLILAGSYAFYRSANIGQTRTQQSNNVATTLARAKEALISRAVTDINRPGSLPCPDLITNNAGFSNYPGDGQADMFTLTQCPSYIGWLPWVTIDLPESTDDTGTRLWYALSPSLRDDDSAHPINSETIAALRIDGGGEIAAIIIAPGAALAGQTRPSNNPADYLEGDNANGDNNYVSGPASATFNDVVAIITRQELMAAVEKRVASEVKVCLEQHALAAANTTHSYPWPAPFSSLNFRGKSGSYFGQLPATQPSAGLNASLLENISQVQTAKNALSNATQASDQLTAAQQLTETLSQARNLYDVMYVVATKLWQSASITANASAALDTEIANDLIPSSTGRVAIINSEQTRIRTAAQTVSDQVDSIYTTLDDSGIDIFPNQLKLRSEQYQAQKNAVNAQAIQLLLTNSTTTHADIGPALANALATSTAAITAANNLSAAPSDAAIITAAANAATALNTAINTLQSTINSSRINRHYSEVSPSATQLNTLNNQVSSSPNASNATALASKLTETKTLLQSIQTGASAILATRSASISAIDQALTAAQASIDYPLINSSTSSAISSINTLVSTMITNDDNLTRTSLASAINDFKTEQAIFAALNIVSTDDRVPYAVNLQNITVDLKYWANLVVAEANSLARQAKGVPIAIGEDFSKVTPLSTSAYQISDNALSSSQNAATAVQTYINTPTSAKQTAASTALADALSTAGSLLSAATTLDASLNSSASSALPIIWLSSRCDAFRDTANSWWNNNQWKNLVFYQISEAIRSATPGRLLVNQSGNYRVVVINAGRALSGQSRGTRTAFNYFEGTINADASRDGDASTPALTFSNQTPSATFNDRLAY
jgi:hypothetical protein